MHFAQIELARLVLDRAPPAASSQLELATAFLLGRVHAEELRDARQDCWTYVGSLACGCSLADSASAHAIMTCLETDTAAHTATSLREQAERVQSCGATEAQILGALAAVRRAQLGS